MNDQEIANKLVEAGILKRSQHGTQSLYSIDGIGYFSANVALTDWRVAGLCLERISNRREFNRFLVPLFENWWRSKANELSRAIITAFVESRNG